MDDNNNHDPADLNALPVPQFAVLYRNQEGAKPADTVVPVIDAMFRDLQAAHRYMNMFRSLAEHEFLTLEEIDRTSCTSTVHSALTARTMRMVITDHGPRAMPREMAALYGRLECDNPDCDCHKEDDNE